MEYPILSDWYWVKENAQIVYEDRENWRYLYGGNGEYLQTHGAAENMVRKMWSAYPSHFRATVLNTGHTIEELIAHVTGKRVADCSGFACLISQGTNPYEAKVPYDMASGSLITVCHDITTDLKKGLCGALLWKSGHVGIDAGRGKVISFENEFIDVVKQYITATKFTKSGLLPWVDYTVKIGANSR